MQKKSGSLYTKRKMNPEELEQHLIGLSRARRFEDKKKLESKYRARGPFSED